MWLVVIVNNANYLRTEQTLASITFQLLKDTLLKIEESEKAGSCMDETQ